MPCALVEVVGQSALFGCLRTDLAWHLTSMVGPKNLAIRKDSGFLGKKLRCGLSGTQLEFFALQLPP
eukprot:6458556-Amphidinium_carterae.1